VLLRQGTDGIRLLKYSWRLCLQQKRLALANWHRNTVASGVLTETGKGRVTFSAPDLMLFYGRDARKPYYLVALLLV